MNTPIDPKVPYEIKKGAREETKERHESFGLVSIHRIQGSKKLFGSHLENQQTYFCLEIKRAEVSHHLSRDWHYPSEQLIEVHLSAAQFAEMITTLNMGSGTPCTVSRILGVEMEPVPQHMESEAKKVKTSFKESLKDLAGALFAQSKKVDLLLEKKSLSKRDREEIGGAFRSAIQDVRDNIPFIFESFQESTEKVVSQAKAEVDAFLSLSLHRIGMDSAQKKLAGEDPSKLLDSGVD